ncbi:MAG: hypothetical protein OEM02_06405 [Desulfobulbaceae bacterium]|nr:hypothetical protein [Desulfobulbaceae bacterium]
MLHIVLFIILRGVSFDAFDPVAVAKLANPKTIAPLFCKNFLLSSIRFITFNKKKRASI